MQMYVIERELPQIGSAGRDAFKDAAAKSNGVLRELAPEIQWVHSYVTQDKIFCIYLAEQANVIQRHAELSGFPANKVTPVKRVIDPTTANQT